MKPARRGPVVVTLPRRSKRTRSKDSNAPSKTPFVPFKRFRPGGVTIASLPSETLFNIFSYLKPSELFYNIRPVCRRWRELAMCPILWRRIEVINSNIPTSVLLQWLKSARLLKSFSATNRHDINVILESVSQNCKRIEEIKIKNCWGSTKNMLVHSNPLCHLISRCPNLYNYNFSQTKFLSCKFFKLISRDMNAGRVMKRCNYIGPMTPKQMEALFVALKHYEVHETATIGNVSLNQKYKLRDLIQYVQDDLNVHHEVVNEIWQNLIIGLEDLEGADRPLVIL